MPTSTPPDVRAALVHTLHALPNQPLAEAGRALLKTLGYPTVRFLDLHPNAPATFVAEFDPHHRLRADRAALADWRTVAVLCQVTDDEVRAALQLAPGAFSQHQVDGAAIASFLFIGLELTGAAYGRAQLAAITRELNRLFPMPVMVLFRYAEVLSLGMVTRRLNRREAERDVLEKVTLIKDVALTQPHRAHLEILAELALPALAHTHTVTHFVGLQTAWEKTLDTSELNRRFFREYRRLFEAAEATLPQDWTAERRRIYTQRFFNRLLFVVFLERKGWLQFNGHRDYLRALFNDYWHHDPEKRPEANFHRKRLNTLFFMGLNYAGGNKHHDPAYAPILSLIGDVPYLNGGLFDEEADDRDGPLFSDALLSDILNQLVYRFVFTVTESTPLDVEVAVDPEMLGKIFEELVTGRHESGSYYTPKPVVQFMGREALKAYLGTATPHEAPTALARFVDEADASALHDPEAVLTALRTITICDPACGSGAYLLGMLHELLTLRESLFATRRLDARTVYQRKLEIIQNNVYGVDLDPFAVNIARLRLWLSLIVDFDGPTPPPLPNLDFKIEAGDSLTAPAPAPLQADIFRDDKVRTLVRLKNEFLGLHAGAQAKKDLLARIAQTKADIRALLPPTDRHAPQSFDWVVEFAEVFAPELAHATRPAAPTPPAAGFDVVLANPPYVRQELIKDLKPALKRVYGPLFVGTADLFVYFYVRAHQLLKPGGVMVFISSNKYLRSAYGQTLRAFLGQHTRLRYLIDFGDSPIFQAIAYPSILVAQKAPPDPNTATFSALSWQASASLEDFDEARRAQTFAMSQSDLTPDGWRLEDRATLRLLDKLRRAGTPLGEYVHGRFYYGIKTGLNEAFVVDRATRDRLIAEHPASAEVLKPLLRGRDVKRWRVEYQDLWLIFTRRGIDINQYPAILCYLEQFKDRLMPGVPDGRKPGSYKWYEIQDNIAYWQEFEQPKIIYPNICKRNEFAWDEHRFYTNQKAFIIPGASKFLLGVLNSSVVYWLFGKTLAKLQGDFYEPSAIFMEKIPIPSAPNPKAIEELVNTILAAKRANPEADTRALEAEIDQHVYALYGLTADEVALVEGRG